MYAGYKAGGGTVSRVSTRFLCFALIAFCLQVTLPYLTPNCPFYGAVGATMHRAAVNSGQMAMDASMPPDCPMLAELNDGLAPPRADTSTPEKHSAVYCSLCDALSLYHACTPAAPLSLPMPVRIAATSNVDYVYSAASVLTALPLRARDPPQAIPV